MNFNRYSAIISATLVEMILCLGLIGIGFTLFDHSVTNWIGGLLENWLVVLFQINILSSDINSQSLQELHWIDFVLFLLIGLVFFRLTQRLRSVNKVFAYIAMSLPIIGVLLLIITKTAGRSGLLLSALVYSILMLKSKDYNKTTAIIGICGSLFLFFGGDIGTTMFKPNGSVASIIFIGYILWIVWYGVILRREIVSELVGGPP